MWALGNHPQIRNWRSNFQLHSSCISLKLILIITVGISLKNCYNTFRIIGFYINCYYNLFLRVELENNTIYSHTATPTFRQFPWDSVSLEGLCPHSFNPVLPGRRATQRFSCVHAELKDHFMSSGHHSAKHCLLSLRFHNLLLLTGIISSVIFIGAGTKWKLRQRGHKLVLSYRLLHPLPFNISGC